MGADELSIVNGLRALAGSDPPAGAQTFTITVDEVPIKVEYTSGSTPMLYLTTPYAPLAVARGSGRLAGLQTTPYRDTYGQAAEPIAAPRPLELRLRHEDDDDRAAVAAGISVEAQTGAPRFDREVYVETEVEPAIAAQILASAPLRAGVLTLFADGFREVVIDNDRGEIAVQRGLSAQAQASAETVAGAFAAIARGVPRIVPTRRRRDLQNAALIVGAVVATMGLFAVAIAFGTVGLFDHLVEWLSLMGMFLVGASAGGGLGWLVSRTIRGRSDSHIRRYVTIFVLGTIGAAAGVLLRLQALLGDVAVLGVVGMTVALAALVGFLAWIE